MKYWSKYLMMAVFAMAALAASSMAQTKVVVDPSKKYQTFEGWGSSLCWWAVKAGAWDEANYQKLVGAIADPDTGLGYTIFRYNIGGGDQPGHNHLTKGDGGGKVPGYKTSESGSYDWSADPGQRNILMALNKRVKDPIYEAFSNSPPWWMTKSGCVSGSNDGSDNLKEDYFDDFAEYLSEVAKHFKTEWGVTFRTVEPFNEPSAGWWKANGDQEGCGFKNNQSKMIVELGKALKSKGLFPETMVSAADETSIKQAHDQLGNYTAEALSYLGQVNTHSYSDGSYRAQLYNRAFALGKRLWQSETGPLHKSGDENITLWMANVIIQDLRDMKAEAWIDWQLGDPAENWRTFAMNHSKQTFSYGPRYYMHAAFSRFIRPGSRIIASDNGNTLAALRPDGALVIVVRNSGSSDVNYSFDLSGFESAGSTVKVHQFALPGSLKALSDLKVANKAIAMTAPSNTVTTLVVADVDPGAGGQCTPSDLIPYVKVHNGGWNETTSVEPNKGDSLVIGPHPYDGGRWLWSGPNGFSYAGREVRFKNMDGTMSGVYTGTYTNAVGCESSVDIKVVVNDPDHPYVEPDTSTTGIRVARRGTELELTAPRQQLHVNVYDMQGVLVKRQEVVGSATLSLQGLPRGAYLVQVRNNRGKTLLQRMVH
jgi:O-glycosyl hydrolase